MLDIKFIRENKQIVQEGAKKKFVDIDIEKLVALDDERLKQLREVEDLRSEVNRVSNDVATEKDSVKRMQLIDEMRAVKEDIKQKEEKLKTIMSEWHQIMLQVPNVPDISVPEGKNDEENVEIRTWGEKPVFNFTPKDHIEIMTELDMADFERGTKVSGFRGYFMKNDGALLFFALWQYFLDYFVKLGYVPMIVPSLVRKEALMGTGYLPQGEDDLYRTQDGEYLAGTAEVAMMSYFSGEVVSKKSLPMKFIAFSPCFRREAGSHGKDIKGIIRVHEFFKLEQVLLCEANHEESAKLHEEITNHVEHLMQELEIPYRIVANCGGDLGLGQVKKYDLETWMPSQNKYRETHSSSYFHDFQARRLNIKYKDEDGKSKYVHSLNNTACATSRLPAAILENYQQADGTIKIPEVLRKYMGGKDFIK
ncbi:serine--tRNA ligase [Candidatus Nomurabacteria bacterium RIFCSPHIGHO2_02_FULL_35_13]|uniref:Serine--tRNA ligase n=1 Tax=Candidatus Nomurabacteria bacterium RIFCSPHIGHO2_02_FULL_35_13 TaxID=1801748 RepID=A0A1F6VPN7_9BACT|nr:MAG: serine--tRNA ligase [Candidatus Nomurabacteria bacterium RIFCSPHIGHO2_02_FULL_35_13]